MRRTILTLLGIAAAIGLLYASTLSQAGVECEVCVEHEGRSVCRTVRGATRDDAIQTALANACAVVGSGVTGRLACERSQTRDPVCREP